MTQHFESGKNMVQTADGNIHLLMRGDVKLPKADYSAQNWLNQSWLYNDNEEYMAHRIVYSTDPSLQGVKQLKRELFVREVDVEELANKAYKEKELESDTAIESGTYKCGYHDGYNAKKVEFTAMQMVNEIVAGISEGMRNPGNTDYMEYVKSRLEAVRYASQPLSLPQSLTIENDVITKINW